MRRLVLAACFAMIVGACSSSDDDGASPSTTEAPTSTTGAPDPTRHLADVEALADDAMGDGTTRPRGRTSRRST